MVSQWCHSGVIVVSLSQNRVKTIRFPNVFLINTENHENHENHQVLRYRTRNSTRSEMSDWLVSCFGNDGHILTHFSKKMTSAGAIRIVTCLVTRKHGFMINTVLTVLTIQSVLTVNRATFCR